MLLKKIFFLSLINKYFAFNFLNTNIPLCINCVHFIKHKTYYPDDILPDDEKYGQCMLFGKVNPITGNINYYYASSCRENKNNMCGIEAKYFKSNK